MYKGTIIHTFYYLAISGEVPKMAEGTPLEREQVVNSGARVQIPPSPFVVRHVCPTAKCTNS